MDRRTLFSIIAVTIFSIGVIIWFFIYAIPHAAPSLGGNVNPLATSNPPTRFQFLRKNNEDDTTSISTTEVTKYTPQALTNIWKGPATGIAFVLVDSLNQVSSTSTEGTTTVTSTRFVHATGTVLMFVDRVTGHIYGYDKTKNKTYQISNTTLPGIYDAYIFNNGKNVVFRYADQEKGIIVGVLATIPKVNDGSQAEPLQKITYLPTSVSSVAMNKKGTKLSYLVSNDSGSSFYTIEEDKKASLITSSPFKEWVLSYGGDTLYATSRPSAYVMGETVRLPTFDLMVGEKTGLVSNPGNGNYILNSMWTNVGLKTFFTNGGTIGVLPITTIASKCSWGNNGLTYCGVPKILPRKVEGLPDDWYQGSSSFDDTISVVDPKKNTSYTIADLKTPTNIAFDITNITMSQDDILIGFIRKQDSSLWLVDTELLVDE